MNKSTVSDDNINMYCDQHKQLFTEMDNVYRCMRPLEIADKLITKIKEYVCKKYYCGEN